MKRTTVVVIGAGQAGLAMSYWLSRRSIEHVVLERGDVANSWRTERWDSLRLLTPNWMTRLPGYRYHGPDPEGYLRAAEVTRFLEHYRNALGAPVQTQSEVVAVRAASTGFRVTESSGGWQCRTVVMATGAASFPRIPGPAGELPNHIEQLTPLDYCNPRTISGDRVLVVGASASGVQLADELRASGKQVTLAVGNHVRVPRTYRGRDIHWWLDATGQLDERAADLDPARTRRVPSLQLVGSPERRAVDVNALSARGVQVTGRLVGVAGNRALLSGSLANACLSADLKMNRLLDLVDHHMEAQGWSGLPSPDRPAPTRVPPAPPTELDLSNVSTVVWATGFAPQYPWLDPALLNTRGELPQREGVTELPGLYVLGLPFMRVRKSSFIDGVGDDARAISAHIVARLSRHAVAA